MEFGDLRGILQYVPQFRDKLFVVLIDEEVIVSDNFSNVVLDLAVLYSLGIRFVVVHGSDERACYLEEEERGDGLILDKAEPMAAVSELMEIIMKDLTYIGLKLVKVAAVTAQENRCSDDAMYLLSSNNIENVNKEGLCNFLESGMVPVVALRSSNQEDRTPLLNADTLAFDVGECLSANKVIVLTADDCIASSSGSECSVTEARAMSREQSDLSDRVNQLLGKAAKACEVGVERVHILDGLRDYAILAELFSNEGVGLMVHRDPYGQVRQAKNSDVTEILSIIRGAVMESELLPRHSADILSCLEDYFILEIDGNVVGTVAVHGGDAFAELACLFVKRNHEGVGYGKRLVDHAEKIAESRGADEIYALSTRATGFFDKIGWELGSLGNVPAKRVAQLEVSGRDSKIYFKAIR